MEEKMNIAIINNIESNIEFYSNLLSLKGYRITGATSVDDFLNKLSDIEPDLVIYDTDLPSREADKFIDLMTKSRFYSLQVLSAILK